MISEIYFSSHSANRKSFFLFMSANFRIPVKEKETVEKKQERRKKKKERKKERMKEWKNDRKKEKEKRKKNHKTDLSFLN